MRLESSITQTGFTYELRSDINLPGEFETIEASMEGDGVSPLIFTEPNFLTSPKKFYRVLKYSE